MDFDATSNDTNAKDPTVYIRPVEVADLPDDVQAQLGQVSRIYALHDTDGERLALVGDRTLAFVLARQNDFAPVSVH